MSEIVEFITFPTLSISLFQTSIVQGIMVSHSEEDLLCVRAAYLKLTGTSLYTALQVGHARNTASKIQQLGVQNKHLNQEFSSF